MGAIRVVVADDHAILRAGLRLLIDSQSDMKVVGEAEGGAAAAQKAREAKADVVLLDLSMPEGGSYGIEETLRARPAARVIVLTMHDDPAYARSAFAAGATGYLVKKAADTELLTAIRAVHRGRTFMDVSLKKPAPDKQRGKATRQKSARLWGASPPLSPRELEVLVGLARGHTNREISGQLGIGVKTVETYRMRLADKLGLRTRAECVAFALEKRLLTTAKGPD